MAEILAAGYAWLRGQVVASWLRVRLYDAGGATQLSLAGSDPRVVVTTSVGDPVVVTITLSGVDADTVGKTFAKAALFLSTDAAYAAPFTSQEVFTAATVGADDSLVITFNLQIPAL